jgi:CRISPR-associated endonuclease/helicase Cas3
MSKPFFRDFFYNATGHRPFRYQVELGEEMLATRVIRVPTGGGKTEAAVLPWLWKIESDPFHAPKRLVIFSPMRALVSQTVGRIEQWLDNLGLSDKIALVELLGEHPELRKRNREWTDEPERPTILVGTVDLLLSAALNRGYAMSRFRWPVAFGLLHNSALWVVDEVQLMGSATSTFAQLEQFRIAFGTMSPVFTWWMSATIEPEWLETVEYVTSPRVTPANAHALIEDLGIKYTAKKPLRQEKVLNGEMVRASHQGSLTLAVVNTVRSARDLYRSLAAPPNSGKKKKKENAPAGSPAVFLIHSRFRQRDRKEKMDRLTQADEALRPDSETKQAYPHGVIVVATQVVESGIDVSAQTMITELAPWPSIVQRFGRLNRTGKETAAQAIWVDVKEPAPYTTEELKAARERIKRLEDVGPASLAEIGLPDREKQTHVIRQHDFLGLYSTDKDLAGGFTDVSDYIRDSDERNVYIGWREFRKGPNSSPLQAELEPHELCPVPIAEASEFRSKGNRFWEWNDETGKWEHRTAYDLVPGMTLLCAASSGGYSVEMGWTGVEQDRPTVAEPPETTENNSNKTDDSSLSDWRELGRHLADVEADVREIGESLSIESSFIESLALAARWHDIGKSLPKWQAEAKRAVEKSKRQYREGIWAKFPADRGTFRPGLRHEEASALYAAQLCRNGLSGWTELAVYLIACHHGKVRTSLGTYGLKSLREVKDRNLYLPGFVDQPTEVVCDLLDFAGSGKYDPGANELEIFGPSWATLIAGLLGSDDSDDGRKQALGPFRLAFLEALITAADGRASRNSHGRENV